MKTKTKKPITNKELKWLLVDFDDTIANNTGHPKYKPTTPIKGAKDALIALTRKGWKITIWTARGYPDYQLIEDWMNKHSMPFRRIICGKPLGKYFIDDRAIEFHGNWKETFDKVV